MTGGFAYVLSHDEENAQINPEHVDVLPLSELPIHQEHLRGLMSEHLTETSSRLAEEILAQFDLYLSQFYLIKPKSSDLKGLLGHIHHSSVEAGMMAQ